MLDNPFELLDRISHTALDEPTEEEETMGHKETFTEGGDLTWKSKVTLSNMFQHPDAHPCALDLRLLQAYGTEYLSWEPETLRIRIPLDFKTQPVSDLTMHKIEAVRTVRLSNAYWRRWEAFVLCTAAFNNNYPDFEVMQVPSVDQCLISCATARHLRSDDETPAWSAEVKAFLATVFEFHGILCPLPPCDFFEIDTRDLVVDCADVTKAWEETKKTRQIPKVSPVVEEQLNRYVAVMVLLELNLLELRQQRRLIEHTTHKVQL